ncbi:MAG: redoxin domain-containing protein [Dysgonamonadaceae bacterium]|jgi:peroxiredoxin|nr:redoxin domain-containing protein [Dysgonamonadaceae bacterium]
MKRKRISVICILCSFICISVVLLLQVIQKRDIQKTAYQTIPAFSLPDVNGQEITGKSLKKHIPTLFLFFDPSCELCHEELQQINANRVKLNNGQIIFFSVEPAGTIRNFLEKLQFSPSPNLFFLIDTNEILVNTMEIKGPPTAIIYGKNGKLIKRFDGPVKIETLIEYLSE